MPPKPTSVPRFLGLRTHVNCRPTSAAEIADAAASLPELSSTVSFRTSFYLLCLRQAFLEGAHCRLGKIHRTETIRKGVAVFCAAEDVDVLAAEGTAGSTRSHNAASGPSRIFPPLTVVAEEDIRPPTHRRITVESMEYVRRMLPENVMSAGRSATSSSARPSKLSDRMLCLWFRADIRDDVLKLLSIGDIRKTCPWTS